MERSSSIVHVHLYSSFSIDSRIIVQIYTTNYVRTLVLDNMSDGFMFLFLLCF